MSVSAVFSLTRRSTDHEARIFSMLLPINPNYRLLPRVNLSILRALFDRELIYATS